MQRPPAPRTARLAAATVLAALAVTACSSGDDPAEVKAGPAASSAAATTTSATSRPTPPPTPRGTKPTTKDAEAFFRYFLEVYTYTYVTHDTAILTRICSRQSKFCESIHDEVARDSEQQLVTKGGEFRPRMAIAAPSSGSHFVVTSVVDQDMTYTYDKNGVTVDVSDGARARKIEAAVQWSSEGWKVLAVRVHPEEKTKGASK